MPRALCGQPGLLHPQHRQLPGHPRRGGDPCRGQGICLSDRRRSAERRAAHARVAGAGTRTARGIPAEHGVGAPRCGRIARGAVAGHLPGAPGSGPGLRLGGGALAVGPHARRARACAPRRPRAPRGACLAPADGALQLAGGAASARTAHRWRAPAAAGGRVGRDADAGDGLEALRSASLWSAVPPRERRQPWRVVAAAGLPAALHFL
mmetsp:Transcript_97697/g.276395  ORF Transcript_97697/g.276395 Transcript_97697/m.276395 type:complete len:208 (+) Transcript_97697:219-842(+)